MTICESISLWIPGKKELAEPRYKDAFGSKIRYFSEISFLLNKFVVREIKVVEASESGEGKLVMGTD